MDPNLVNFVQNWNKKKTENSFMFVHVFFNVLVKIRQIVCISTGSSLHSWHNFYPAHMRNWRETSFMPCLKPYV